MAATNYTSRNILWSFITALADGDLVTMTLLYNEGLQRLHDGQGALLGRIATVYSDLSSTAVGTKARIVGNVDMTAFNYNSGIALSGLTVIVDENTSTAQTCTFSNAVTGPDVLLTQLTAQCGTNLTWSLNDSGQLVCTVGTIGAGSTIALGAGTAHSTIWPSPTITSPGAGTVNDGASRIGLGAFGSWGGGTLQAYQESFHASVTAIAASVVGKVAKAGDTMTGALTAPSLIINDVNNTVTVATRGVTRSVSSTSSVDLTEWSQADTGRFVSLVDTGSRIVMPLDVPHGATLINAIVTFTGAGGHAALPAVMPSVTIVKTNLLTGADTTISDTDDPSATVGAYQAIHTFGPTSLSEVIDKSVYRYNLNVSSEAGANALSGGVLFGVRVTATVSRIDEF